MVEKPRIEKKSTILILTFTERRLLKKAVPTIYLPKEILNYDNLNQKFPSETISKAFVMSQLKKRGVLEPNRYFANLYCNGRAFKRFFDGEITEKDIDLYEKGLYHC